MITTTKISYKEIESVGWTLLSHKTYDESLILLSGVLGNILPDDNGNKIQYLRPKERGLGIKDSLSYKYGLDEFPYHTDTAFWDNPAKLILMTSKQPSSCQTLLIDIQELLNSLPERELSYFHNSVYTLKTPNQIKFVSVLQRKGEDFIFRYDPNIMVPYNSNAKKAEEIISSFIREVKPVQIEWTGENVLLLNNWRLLHKRSECKNEPQRVLKRIYINQ